MIPVAVTFFLKPLLTAKWRLGTIFLALFFTWLRLLSKCSPISYYGLKWKGRPQCCYDYGFPFFLAMALSSCSKTIVHSRHERVSCIETKLGGRVHILQLLEECWWCIQVNIATDCYLFYKRTILKYNTIPSSFAWEGGTIINYTFTFSVYE